MTSKALIDDKTAEAGDAVERGHAPWKRAKIECALAQAQDRDAMISADQVLRDFDLEP